MIFKAIVVEQKDGDGISRTSFKLDPWEKDLGARNRSRPQAGMPSIGDLKVGQWYSWAWPSFAFCDTIRPVGKDGEFTIFRRDVDEERRKRWEDQGERFQVDSFA